MLGSAAVTTWTSQCFNTLVYFSHSYKACLWGKALSWSLREVHGTFFLGSTTSTRGVKDGLNRGKRAGGCVCVHTCVQSCPTLCNPMDCSPPGSSVHELFQARILEWVAISYSRGSSQPRDWICIPCVSGIGRWILYHCATWEAGGLCSSN